MPGTTYILGAGASRADSLHLPLPLPLARDFFKSAYINKHWPDHLYNGFPIFKDSALCKVLEHYFSLRWKRKRAGKVVDEDINVEDVYSFLVNFESTLSAHAPRDGILSRARKELLEYIGHVVRYSAWDITKPVLHQHIVKSLKESDSIISFNWDLILDSVLAASVRGQALLDSQKLLLTAHIRHNETLSGYSERARSELHSGYLLKLHGALNMVTCRNTTCAYFHFPYLFDVKDEMPEDWPCRACGSATELLIVPPHVHKNLATNNFLRSQASHAQKTLGVSDEIIIIGYSFPTFDFDAETIFRSARLDPGESEHSQAWLRRIIIVNPQVSEPRYIARVKNIFGINNGKRAYGHAIKFETYPSVDLYLTRGGKD